MEYSNSRIREIIGEYIHDEKHRKLMARRLIDNVTIDRLAEEFDLSVSQVKRIIWKDSEIIFRHLEKLTDAVKNAPAGDFRVTLAPEILQADDEVGVLAQQFQHLMDQIDNLIHQELQGKLQAARARCRMLQAQIHPHFLYNTLGAIREMCDDPEAKKAIGRFTRYLQGNMDALTKSDTIPFAVELEHTKAYLELEQLRFESALCVVYDIACTDFELPTLTVQPIAENAVRHGARSGEKDVGTVTIATREFPDRYEVTVTDDGPGFDPEHLTPKDDGRAHIGIQNVRERLRDICAGELRIESEIGKGTTVTLLLPKAQ